MRVGSVALLIAVGLAAGLQGHSAADIDTLDLQRATRLTGKGEKALRAGNLTRAEQQFSRALEILPVLPEAHAGVGHVLMRRREFAQAYDAFNRAARSYVEIGSELFEIRIERYNEAREELARLEMQMADAEATLGNLMTANSASDPANAAQIRSLRARIASQRQRMTYLATVEPPPLDESDPVPGRIHFFQGNALLNLDRIEEAIAAWEQCAEKSPSFSLVYNNLAVGYWRQGRLDRAFENLRQAENLGFPVNPAFKAELAGSIALDEEGSSTPIEE